MLNPFPIVSAINFFSIVVLAVLILHLYIRAKKPLSPTMQAFIVFFVFIWMMLALLTVPLSGNVVRDTELNQVLSNISDLFFYGAIAFFARVIFLFTFPRNRLMTVGIPLSCIILGIIILVWEMIDFTPSKTFLAGGIVGYPFIFYTNEAPLATQLINGLLTLFVFMGGAVFFLRQAWALKERTPRLRSLLLGIAFVIGTMGGISDFLFSTLPNAVYAFFIAAILVNISLVLMYAGVLIHARTKLGE